MYCMHTSPVLDLTKQMPTTPSNKEYVQPSCSVWPQPNRRCQELSNGAMVPGVADLWGRDAPGDARRLVSPEQLRRQLGRVQQQRAVAVLLVDLLDASGSFLGKVRDLVGRNPVILVGTKARPGVLQVCNKLWSLTKA